MNRFRAMCLAVTVLGLMLSAGCKQTQRARASAPIGDERRKQHVASFDQVWATIRDNHWDKNLNGVDWEAAKSELRPRVEAAKTDAEARAAMEDLIHRLKQSHFGIIPAEAYEKVDALPKRRGEEGTASVGASGLRVRVVGDDAIVTSVDPESAGADAGVQPGWLVLRAGKFDTADVLQRVRAAHGSSNLLKAYESLTMQQMLSGDLGEEVNAVFLDGANRKVRKQLKLKTPAGNPSKFGNLPTFYVATDVKEVAPGVGYFALSAFFDAERASIRFREAVDQFKGAKGMIIDLRGNPGGIGFMANGMAGSLVDKDGLQLGKMTTRGTSIQFVIFKQPTVYNGPLAVLIDECSMSTSEIMAGGLKDIGRARVFGTASPGAALPSRIEKLPNGDGFQYAFANYESANGDVLEGKGVQPNEVTPPNRQALLSGKDPAIEAAVAWIESQASGK